MKTLGKIISGILVCLVLFLLTARVTGFEPRTCANIYEAWSCRLPGLWLRGDVVTTPVTDWSFTDAIPTVKLQTHTWYLLPHSVNIGCVYYNGHLYLSSVYMRPDVKYRWNEDVLRDPRVRLKIGDKLYDRTLSYVTDPADYPDPKDWSFGRSPVSAVTGFTGIRFPSHHSQTARRSI